MNTGKIFEEAIKNSLPDYILFHRLNDPPQSFNKSDTLRFSWKNPCDMFCFDSKRKLFYTLELKSVNGKSMSFDDINSNEKTKSSHTIHKHQILELMNFSKYDNVVSGFLFNFRDDKKLEQKTYFQSIDDFITMINEVNKRSFNINDLLKYNPIEINGKKKRVKFNWYMNEFFENFNKE